MRAPEGERAASIATQLRRCVRLLPHYDDCGGFFVAVFRKPDRPLRSGATVTSVTADERMPTAEEAADSSTGVAAPHAIGQVERGEHSNDRHEDDSGPHSADHDSGAARDGSRGVSRSEGSVALEGSVEDAALLLEPLPLDSDEWVQIERFYGLGALRDGQVLLRAPGRAARREKLYLASEGAARLMIEHWRPAATRDRRSAARLKGRLHALGVKAFERLKLTNVRSRAAYPCAWRPCQQALPFLPSFGKRVLVTQDERFFAHVLRERTIGREELLAATAGIDSCTDEAGDIVPGGVVLSLLDHQGSPSPSTPPSTSPSASSTPSPNGAGDIPIRAPAELAHVASVLTPGRLQVWAPKEEVVGLLALLDDAERNAER